jgi:hypothetical protein
MLHDSSFAETVSLLDLIYWKLDLMKTYLVILSVGMYASMSHAQQSLQNQNTPTMNHGQMDHATHMAQMQAQRQSEVAVRGKDVMPFDLSATVHIFTKSKSGGIQRVVARKLSDSKQVQLTREHLKEIQGQFVKGDFSGPTHIHGAQMPGLFELKSATAGQIAIEYREVKGGAEINYKTSDTQLVSALHKWFDAQVSDHGKDAMKNHNHKH